MVPVIINVNGPVFIFFFSIDGTFSKRMGRFVNDAPRHEHQCNADMEKLFIDYRPVLVLFARRFIKAGEEIRYDYGVKNLPWRCKKVKRVFHWRELDIPVFKEAG